MKNNAAYFVGKRVRTRDSVKDYPGKTGRIEKTASVFGYFTVYVRFDGEDREHGFAPEELCSP
jgi:hypothetical protein